MKTNLYILFTLLVCSLAATAQDYQQAFVDVQQQFEQRLKTAPGELKSYLEE